MLKDWRGWLAFAIFGAACWFVGDNRLMNKNLPLSLVIFLAASVVVWALLCAKRGDAGLADEVDELNVKSSVRTAKITTKNKEENHD